MTEVRSEPLRVLSYIAKSTSLKNRHGVDILFDVWMGKEMILSSSSFKNYTIYFRDLGSLSCFLKVAQHRIAGQVSNSDLLM